MLFSHGSGADGFHLAQCRQSPISARHQRDQARSLEPHVGALCTRVSRGRRWARRAAMAAIGRRCRAAADAMQLLDPLAIHDISLSARHVLHVPRIDEHHVEAPASRIAQSGIQ